VIDPAAPSVVVPSVAAIDAVRALARASRVIERVSAPLSLADYRVLAAIASGEARASRLADRLAIGKPAISASVDSLCKRGLLDRSVVEGDQRATSLSLTADGSALFAEVEGTMAAGIAALAERTPDPARMLEALAWLGEAIETVMVERAAEVTA
jgi:DNA-binding MarR family transcriptional regulator